MNNDLIENIIIADKVDRIAIQRNWVDLGNPRKCCVVEHFSNTIYFIRENSIKYINIFQETIDTINTEKDIGTLKQLLDGKIIDRLKENGVCKCSITFIDTYKKNPSGNIVTYTIN